jgi:hypothetical protein
MHERELLDLLAGGAPEPSAGLPDRVVAAGRRARRRRRLGAGAAAGLVVATVLALALPRSAGPARNVADPPAATVAPSSPKVPGPAPLSGTEGQVPRSKSNRDPAMKFAPADSRVPIYTIVIGRALGPAAAKTARSLTAVYIVDRACPLEGDCTGPVFDDGLKTGLVAALGRDNVSFGPEGNATAQPGPVVRLGEIKLTGDGAVVPVSVMRYRNGVGEGSGTTYQLKSRSGRWSVVSTNGPSWIT